MDEGKLRTLLQRYRSGKIEEDALLRELRGMPFRELDSRRSTTTGRSAAAFRK
jgi:hypothetical protein